MPPQISQNEAVKEIFQCARDPIYFMNKYVKIQHTDRGLIDFKTYDYQDEMVRNLLTYRNNIVNKGRQLGFTTLTAAYIAWLVLFHSDKTVLIVSINADIAKNMLKKVKVVLKHLPPWMFLTSIEINQAHTLQFTNGSFVKSIGTKDNSGRSESMSLLVIDEAAHIQKMDEVWKGVSSTTATGGNTLIISTPKGMGNFFHTECMKAKTGESDYHYSEYPWYVNPEYAAGMYDDPDAPGGKRSPWFDRFTAGWSKLLIFQELLTNFLESGNTFFEKSVMDKIKKCTENLPILDRIFMDRNFWIWKKSVQGRKYVIGADVATGAGEDFSAFVVLDVESAEVVAEYMGKIPIDLYAQFLIDASNMYNGALIVPENDGMGLALIVMLDNLKCKTLAYFDKDTGKLLDKWTAQYQNVLGGFNTNPRTRPIVLSKLEELFRKDLIVSYSIRFHTQLETFTWQKGRPAAMKNHHDDIIMALAIAVWVRDSCFSYRGAATMGPSFYDNVAIVRNEMDQQKMFDSYKNKRDEKRRQDMRSQHYLQFGDKLFPLRLIYK